MTDVDDSTVHLTSSYDRPCRNSCCGYIRYIGLPGLHLLQGRTRTVHRAWASRPNLHCSVSSLTLSSVCSPITKIFLRFIIPCWNRWKRAIRWCKNYRNIIMLMSEICNIPGWKNSLYSLLDQTFIKQRSLNSGLLPLRPCHIVQYFV